MQQKILSAFKNHKEVDVFHVTSDGRPFKTDHMASAQAQALKKAGKSDKVETVTRAEYEKYLKEQENTGTDGGAGGGNDLPALTGTQKGQLTRATNKVIAAQTAYDEAVANKVKPEDMAVLQTILDEATQAVAALQESFKQS